MCVFELLLLSFGKAICLCVFYDAINKLNIIFHPYLSRAPAIGIAHMMMRIFIYIYIYSELNYSGGTCGSLAIPKRRSTH